MNLIRGQKVKLSDLTKSLDIEVGIHIEYGGPDSIDVTCFGVDENNRLSDDRYFITPEGGFSPPDRALGPWFKTTGFQPYSLSAGGSVRQFFMPPAFSWWLFT